MTVQFHRLAVLDVSRLSVLLFGFVHTGCCTRMSVMQVGSAVSSELHCSLGITRDVRIPALDGTSVTV